jgi:hypothetical protein
VAFTYRLWNTNGTRTEKSLRKMRSYTCTKWNGIHLQLRMHILRELRRANELRLPKLRR